MPIISKSYTKKGRKEHDRIFKQCVVTMGYTEAELEKLSQAGISGAKAGKALRKSLNLLKKIQHKKKVKK